jgi:uncharacterized protein (TIGR03067 family)
VAGAVAQDAGKEQKDLQGVWTVTEVISKGKKLSPEQQGIESMEFKGDKIIGVGKRAGKEERMEAKYKLSAQGSPPEIDITFEQNGKEKKVLCIYELKGDTLKLCHYEGPMGETQRPKSVEATKETAFAVLKRKS